MIVVYLHCSQWSLLSYSIYQLWGKCPCCFSIMKPLITGLRFLGLLLMIWCYIQKSNRLELASPAQKIWTLNPLFCSANSVFVCITFKIYPNYNWNILLHINLNLSIDFMQDKFWSFDELCLYDWFRSIMYRAGQTFDLTAYFIDFVVMLENFLNMANFDENSLWMMTKKTQCS